MEKQNENVYHLENFDLIVKNGNVEILPLDKDIVFILMCMADWCGHCKNMHPDFVKAANEMKDNKVKFVIANEKDIDKNKLNLLKINGFPIVLKVKNGKVVETFKGPRTVESIHHFAKTDSHPEHHR